MPIPYYPHLPLIKTKKLQKMFFLKHFFPYLKTLQVNDFFNKKFYTKFGQKLKIGQKLNIGQKLKIGQKMKIGHIFSVTRKIYFLKMKFLAKIRILDKNPSYGITSQFRCENKLF